ncbi:MAG TPA: hypothetical protein VGO47_02415 [Chlamydiales bacterium]|jgi:hypothetical protein|nr:hypothetical protein [Chlamydiales bacterium]
MARALCSSPGRRERHYRCSKLTGNACCTISKGFEVSFFFFLLTKKIVTVIIHAHSDATPSERLAMEDIHAGLGTVMDVDASIWDVQHAEDYDWECGDLTEAADGTYAVNYHTQEVTQETTGQVADVYYHFFVGRYVHCFSFCLL